MTIQLRKLIILFILLSPLLSYSQQKEDLQVITSFPDVDPEFPGGMKEKYLSVSKELEVSK